MRVFNNQMKITNKNKKILSNNSIKISNSCGGKDEGLIMAAMKRG